MSKRKRRHPDSKVIDALGGTVAVATLCGIKSPSVSQWRWDGISGGFRKFLMLKHPEAFELQDKAA